MRNGSGVRGLASPARAPVGEVRVPASKSEAIRALLVASLSEGAVEIGPLPPGRDVAAALRVVEQLGAEVEQRGAGARVTAGTQVTAGAQGGGPRALDVGESATLARCATALAARGESATRVQGEGTLARRRSAPLFRALERAGASLAWDAAPDGWPVLVHGAGRCTELLLEHPCSSQEASALLLFLAGQGGGTLAVTGPIPSASYLALTMHVLERFGVRVREEAGEGGVRRFAVAGRPALAEAYALEPDASLAAVPLAAACLAGGELSVPGLLPATPQGAERLARHLAAFGCRAAALPAGLRAGGRPLRGAVLELELDPDLAPVLAALAADAALRLGQVSRLSGLGTLAGKESDRLLGIAAALRAAGAAVRATESEVEVAPGGTRAPDLVLDPQGDHRMAFLHALLGLVVPGIATRDAGCVGKTWPAFFEDMAALGFGVLSGA